MKRFPLFWYDVLLVVLFVLAILAIALLGR